MFNFTFKVWEKHNFIYLILQPALSAVSLRLQCGAEKTLQNCTKTCVSVFLILCCWLQVRRKKNNKKSQYSSVIVQYPPERDFTLLCIIWICFCGVVGWCVKRCFNICNVTLLLLTPHNHVQVQVCDLLRSGKNCVMKWTKKLSKKSN